MLSILKWLAFSGLSILASLSAFVVVPIFAATRWPEWAWAIWGNDDGAILGYSDEYDDPQRLPYIKQVLWLLRNRGHALSLHLGAVVGVTTHYGDDKVSNQGYPGWWLIVQRGAFELYVVRRLSKGLCFRLRLGWKLHGWGPGSLALLVHHVSIHRFTPRTQE